MISIFIQSLMPNKQIDAEQTNRKLWAFYEPLISAISPSNQAQCDLRKVRKYQHFCTINPSRYSSSLWKGSWSLIDFESGVLQVGCLTLLLPLSIQDLLLWHSLPPLLIYFRRHENNPIGMISDDLKNTRQTDKNPCKEPRVSMLTLHWKIILQMMVADHGEDILLISRLLFCKPLSKIST